MVSKTQKWGIVLIALLLVIYVFLFVYQNGNSTTEVTEIYFADRITAAHRKLIDKYNARMQGKVKVVPVDFPNFDFSTNERKEVLARSLRGMGDGIDLLAVDIIWVQRFAKWCEPLDKYFSESEKKRFLPTALESCYSGGELAAVPLDLVQGVLYYREDLLKKIPGGDEIIAKIRNGITWEEFIELKSRVGNGRPFYIFPAADYEGLICSFVEIVTSIKPDYFDMYGFNLQKPEAEKALQFIVDLIHKYNLSPQDVTKFTDVPSYKYFIEHDGLFVRGWPSYDKDFEDFPFDLAKEKNLKKAPLPRFKNGIQASTLGGWNLMISKFSEKKKETIDFVKFLLSDSSQEIFYKESGYYPVIRKFYEDEELIKRYPELEQIRKLIKSGIHRPYHVDYTRYSNIMSYYFDLALKNKISVKKALESATYDIQISRDTIKEF